MTQQALKSPMTAVDAPPEFFHYEDTGCEASPSCLNCPLPQCKHDDPIWYRRNRKLAKDLQVVSVMRLEDLSVEAAAERFSVTVRTIFRIMRRCRNAGVSVNGLGDASAMDSESQALAA